VVVGDKGLAKGVVEYKARRDKDVREVALERITGMLGETIRL
jgi:hypothetical protein